MNSLMNSIDTIKQKITDAEYKELCDKMMELNNNKKDFYEILYIEPYITERVVDEAREYLQSVKINKRIVQMYMSETELDHANNKIKEIGRWEPNTTYDNHKIFKDIIYDRDIQFLITTDDNGNDVALNVFPSKCLSIISIKKL